MSDMWFVQPEECIFADALKDKSFSESWKIN